MSRARKKKPNPVRSKREERKVPFGEEEREAGGKRARRAKQS
jgi:hypothetical protein